jgi:hypothetical protein
MWTESATMIQRILARLLPDFDEWKEMTAWVINMLRINMLAKRSVTTLKHFQSIRVKVMTWQFRNILIVNTNHKASFITLNRPLAGVATSGWGCITNW